MNMYDVYLSIYFLLVFSNDPLGLKVRLSMRANAARRLSAKKRLEL